MLRWISTGATLLVLALPTLGPAQTGVLNVPAADPPRFRVVPFLGYRLGFDAPYRYNVSVPGQLVTGRVESETTGGLTFGGGLEVHVWGPIGVTAGIVYTPATETREVVTEEGETTTPPPFESSTFLLTRLGLGIELREDAMEHRVYKPRALLSIGGALLRETPPRGSIWGPDAIWHPGLALGAELEIQLFHPRIGVQIAVDDFLNFWNERELVERTERYLREQTGQDAVVLYEFNTTHMLLLRAGVSVRI